MPPIPEINVQWKFIYIYTLQRFITVPQHFSKVLPQWQYNGVCKMPCPALGSLG